MVLIKNKCDFEKTIDLKGVKSIAETHDIKFSATSATNGKGVDETFHKCIRKIKEKRKRESPKSKKCFGLETIC